MSARAAAGAPWTWIGSPSVAAESRMLAIRLEIIMITSANLNTLTLKFNFSNLFAGINLKMPSSWNVYYAVFLSAALGLGIPGGLLLLSRVLRGGSPHAQDARPLLPNEANNKSILGSRINVRFFLAANASILLVALAFLLIPCVVSLQGDDRLIAFRSLLSIVCISLIASLALFYAFKKGDLDWLKTFRSKP
jgi:NADH:ubiquinone oxidoreductase subunit 3 (subunit A)